MTKAAEIGKAIADAIREHGHYQGTSATAGGVCLLHNPYVWSWNVGAMESARFGVDDQELFEQALTSHIGDEDIISWNDNTPTETVLETLESL